MEGGREGWRAEGREGGVGNELLLYLVVILLRREGAKEEVEEREEGRKGR